MTDKDNIMIEDFFKQAAMQQIEDNGFTERVMMNLPEVKVDKVRRLSRLWTWFCVTLNNSHALDLIFSKGKMRLD